MYKTILTKQSKRFYSITLIVIGIIFQILLWLPSDVPVVKLGDDSEGYVFQGLEILNTFNTDPPWDVKQPGYSATIAFLLSIFGQENLFVLTSGFSLHCKSEGQNDE